MVDGVTGGEPAAHDPAAARAAIPLPRPARLMAVTAVMLASGMQAADATIANVALPQLELDLGGGIIGAGWVITSYLCATAVVAPLTGALRRRFGARNLFLGALGVFATASLLCSLAPTASAIVLFRIMQGAAGGVVYPLAQAILLDLYPREQHGRIIAAWGATVMLGPILGPIVGGVVTDLTSWRLVFVVNLPIAGIAAWAMARALPPTARQSDLPIDMLGVALLAVSVGALQLFLTRSGGGPVLASPELMLEGTSAVVAFTALVLRARRTAFAVFRPAVFADLNFAAAAFYNFTGSALLFVVIVFVPALCQGPLEYSATLAGAILVPRGIASLLMILVAGQLVGRVDGRFLLAASLTAIAAGLAVLSTARPPDALHVIVIGTMLQAMGGGMLLTALSTIGFSSLVPELRTDAAGVYSLLRQLGCASGVALMTAVVHALLRPGQSGLADPVDAANATPSPELLQVATLEAYTAAFAAMAIAALVLLPGVLLFRAGRIGRPSVSGLGSNWRLSK